MFQHTSGIVDLDIEGYPNMLRKESEAVYEGNGPVPRQEEFGPDQPTLTDVYRLFEKRFERELKGVKSHLAKTDMLANKIERNKTAFSRSGAGRSEATSCHGSRRASRHQDSRTHERRR